VHFTGNEMVWECNARNVCECGHIAHGATPFIKSRLQKLTRQLPESSKGHDGSEAARLWAVIVRDYSHRKLTNTGDKLVALSGLARAILEYVGQPSSIYAAGLWSSELPKHLLWRRIDSNIASSEPRRSSGCRAPTWSWASLDHAVEYGSDIFGPETVHLKIIECVIDLQSPLHPMGAVAWGRLTVKGFLRPVDVLVKNMKGNITTGPRRRMCRHNR